MNYNEENNSTKEGNIVKDPAVNYQTEKRLYTLEDYYALPDDQRVELIDGVFHVMLAPSITHQTFCMEITNKIWNFIQKKKGKCKVLPSPVDVQLDCDDKTMVEPDFVVEVLSSSTMKKDIFLKLEKYENAGVREYWMIDAKKKRVITYFFEEDFAPVIYGMDAKIPVKIFNGELEIDFEEIQEYLKSYGNLERE